MNHSDSLKTYKLIIKANEKKTDLWLESLKILYEMKKTKEKFLNNPYFTFTKKELEEISLEKIELEEKIKFKENEIVEMQNSISYCQKQIKEYLSKI